MVIIQRVFNVLSVCFWSFISNLYEVPFVPLSKGEFNVIIIQVLLFVLTLFFHRKLKWPVWTPSKEEKRTLLFCRASEPMNTKASDS